MPLTTFRSVVISYGISTGIYSLIFLWLYSLDKLNLPVYYSWSECNVKNKVNMCVFFSFFYLFSGLYSDVSASLHMPFTGMTHLLHTTCTGFCLYALALVEICDLYWWRKVRDWRKPGELACHTYQESNPGHSSSKRELYQQSKPCSCSMGLTFGFRQSKMVIAN